jgi:hypothetical protein
VDEVLDHVAEEGVERLERERRALLDARRERGLERGEQPDSYS